GSGLRLGTGTYVINAGTITAGKSDRAEGAGDAVDIVGSNNTFEIWKDSNITGNVVVADGTSGNVLVWGGDDNSSFNVSSLGKQYQGFQGFRKTGKSTWTLTGNGNFEGGIEIAGGTLSVTRDANLGKASNIITMNGGTLQLGLGFHTNREVRLSGNGTFDTQSYTSTFSGDITGTGQLTKTGSGTLILTGDNTYQGGTIISAGTLQIGSGDAQGAV
uniref:autotransporter-associated beta strand repeat-containing protein n=1 Tax=Brucella anthropi TaxID=529 RepID=UPI0023601CFB